MHKSDLASSLRFISAAHRANRCAALSLAALAVFGYAGIARADHIFSPGDPIVAIDPDPGPTPSSPADGGENVEKMIDGSATTKYLNFGREGSGLIVTPGASVVKSFVLTTANDAAERDPLAYQLFGTNNPINSAPFSAGTGESWSLISTGQTGLLTDPGRNAVGQFVNLPSNAASYNSYKLQFGQLRTSANGNSMQVSELQMFSGTAGGGSTILGPANPTVPIDYLSGDSRYPFTELPAEVIDGDKSATSKYLNFGRLNSGFIVTPSVGSTVANGFVLTTANDVATRDPLTYEIWGRNGAITTPDNGLGTEDAWTLITSGTLPVVAARNTDMPLVLFNNSTAYTSYKIDFPTNNGSGTAIQLSEFDLMSNAPEPGSIGILTFAALVLGRRKARH
jgi:hypothetical protein